MNYNEDKIFKDSWTKAPWKCYGFEWQSFSCMYALSSLAIFDLTRKLIKYSTKNVVVNKKNNGLIIN